MESVVRLMWLTEAQRHEMFRSTGLYVRRLKVAPFQAAAAVVDRCCSRCLLADDLPGVSIDASGVCNQCLAFEQEQRSGHYAPEILLNTIASARGQQTPDCVVAFSGGKDSALAVLLAVRQHGLKPIALMVDNGFIPEEVQQQGAAFCRSLGVELLVRKIDIRAAARESLSSTVKSIPCRTCISGVFARIGELCRELGLRLVIGGHRFPPLAYSLSGFTKKPEDQEIQCVSPLLAHRIAERDQLRILADFGWKRVEIAGNTSNCKLIGVVEARHFDAFGYNPHLFEVSKEIRAGILSRAEALDKIDRPRVPPEHEAWVLQRIEQLSADPPAASEGGEMVTDSQLAAAAAAASEDRHDGLSGHH